MEKLLMLYRAAAALAPIVRQGMDLAQAMLPEGGQGAARLAMVKAHVQAAIEEAKLVEAKFEEVWPVLARNITPVVDALKLLGIYKSIAPAVAAVETAASAVSLFKTSLGGASQPSAATPGATAA